MPWVREGRLRRVWSDVRKVGGSILNHRGENLTGGSYDADTFVNM